MQLNLMDMNKFVKVNPTMIGHVTNPIFLDRNRVPTSDGLLSTEIFGNTTRERARKFGYVDLGGYYFQPIILKNLRRLDRRIDAIASGKMRVRIEKDGSMVQDDDKGQTGLEFLYRNWEKIKYKKNESDAHNDRVDLFKNHTKSEMFTNVWIVCPAMYRDINMQDVDTKKIGVDTVNNLYSRLIRLTSMINQDSSFTPIMHNTRYMIQTTLIEIYDYFKNMIQKKNGIVRRSLLGKSIDYGARLVITSPNYNCNSYKDSEIDFYHAGVPLANCCNLFTPFILGWVRSFLQRELEFIGEKYPILKSLNGSTEVEFKPLKDPMSYYNDEAIRKLMDTFIYSYGGRFAPIIVPTEDMDKHPIKMVFTGRQFASGNTEGAILGRYMTLTDLFYMAAVNVCENKYVYITRYPLTDYMGVFPIGIKVMSTIKTVKMQVGDRVYENYPVIDKDLKETDVAGQFIDTLRFQNCYLKAIGGDYDGDTVTIKGVFSQSANKEAERIMKSKINIIGISGKGIRKTTNETVQTLYSMTKFAK